MGWGREEMGPGPQQPMSGAYTPFPAHLLILYDSLNQPWRGLGYPPWLIQGLDPFHHVSVEVIFLCKASPQLEAVSTFPQETVARSWSHTAAPLEHQVSLQH